MLEETERMDIGASINPTEQTCFRENILTEREQG
jgi:hypothetical protein